MTENETARLTSSGLCGIEQTSGPDGHSLAGRLRRCERSNAAGSSGTDSCNNEGAMKMSPTEVEQALRRVAIFACLADDKITALSRATEHRRYSHGATILQSGQNAPGVYIILAGRAKAVMANEDGRVMTLSILETDDFFGRMGLPDQYENASGVEALDACEVLYVPAAAFRAGIDGNYEAAMRIVQSVEARLCKAQRKIASLGLLDVYGRVASLLIESARQVEGRWLVETGVEEIARTVAASREMVSRVVKKLSEQGFVRRDKRTTVILDRESMAAARPI